MKKKIFLALAICLFLGTSKVSAATVKSYFSDENFFNCIAESANITETTEETDFNFESITELNCHSREINNVQGIEKFTGLQTLNISENRIEKIDLSKNTALTDLKILLNPIAQFISTAPNQTIDLSEYVKMPSGFTIDYTINDTSIAEYNPSTNQITPKKIGNTTAILSITNDTLTLETTFNSNLTIAKICPLTGGSIYKIDFITNGANEIESIQNTITLGEDASQMKIDLPTPTRTGYNFIGWYEDELLTKLTNVKNYAEIRNMSSVKNDECGNLTATLYAKWEKIEETTQDTTEEKSTSDTTKNPKTGIYGGSLLLIGAALGTFAIIKIKEKKNTI